MVGRVQTGGEAVDGVAGAWQLGEFLGERHDAIPELSDTFPGDPRVAKDRPEIVGEGDIDAARELVASTAALFRRLQACGRIEPAPQRCSGSVCSSFSRPADRAPQAAREPAPTHPRGGSPDRDPGSAARRRPAARPRHRRRATDVAPARSNGRGGAERGPWLRGAGLGTPTCRPSSSRRTSGTAPCSGTARSRPRSNRRWRWCGWNDRRRSPKVHRDRHAGAIPRVTGSDGSVRPGSLLTSQEWAGRVRVRPPRRTRSRGRPWTPG